MSSYKNDSVFVLLKSLSVQHALSIFSLQDKEPAGIIFAEDIHVQDVLQDLEEAQKDISKVCLYKLTHLVRTLTSFRLLCYAHFQHVPG